MIVSYRHIVAIPNPTFQELSSLVLDQNSGLLTDLYYLESENVVRVQQRIRLRPQTA